MLTARIILALAALMFGAFGVWLLLDPESLGDLTGVVASGPAARTEVRAFYGGLEIGFAAFFVLGCCRPKIAATACLCLGVVVTGLVLGRIFGMVADGSFSNQLLAFVMIEAVFAGLGFLGFARAKDD